MCPTIPHPIPHVGANGTAVASVILRRRTVMAQMGTGEQESTVDMGNALAGEQRATSELMRRWDKWI